jgi:hypothetical protein
MFSILEVSAFDAPGAGSGNVLYRFQWRRSTRFLVKAEAIHVPSESSLYRSFEVECVSGGNGVPGRHWIRGVWSSEPYGVIGLFGTLRRNLQS